MKCPARALILPGLFAVAIGLGACAPPVGSLSPTAEATRLPDAAIPTEVPAEETAEDLVGTEPMAPLLARGSATYDGEEVTLAEIRESPQDFEGQSVQIVGRLVDLEGAGQGLGTPPFNGDVWAIDDGTGAIYVVNVRPPSQAAGGEEIGELLLIGQIALTPEGVPYIDGGGLVMRRGGTGEFEGARLAQAEDLVNQLEAKGHDMRLARVYIGTAQWLSLSERPDEAAWYLDLAYQILEDPDRFNGLAEDLPPRTPIHAFPTPPGTRVPLPEGDRGQ